MSEGIRKKHKSSFNKRSSGFFSDKATDPPPASTAPEVDKNLTDLEKKINKTIAAKPNATKIPPKPNNTKPNDPVPPPTPPVVVPPVVVPPVIVPPVIVPPVITPPPVEPTKPVEPPKQADPPK